MGNQKTFLFAAIVLAMASVANADLILTLNGFDAANEPIEIEGKDNLIISIVGTTQADVNNYSVTTIGGTLEVHTDDYLFTFENELGVVSLIANQDMVIDSISVLAGGTIYELVLFYIPQTDTVIAFGVNLENLNLIPRGQANHTQETSDSEVENEDANSYTQDILAATSNQPAILYTRGDEAWLERDKLLVTDGAAGDSFGYSVSVSGDYAIVGAPYDDDKGNNSGSAYIFKWDGESWNQQQKLLASDGAVGDSFGESVSISGGFAIVGAKRNDDNGAQSGSAYIFKRDGESWTEQAKLLASDGAAYDFFGGSVSISSDYAIVGAPDDDDKGNYSGSTYIFKRDGESWSQQQKLLASDGAGYDFFGYSVSISGDYTIVGAHNDDDNGAQSGSVYIFKSDGAGWIQQQKLLASDGAAGDNFGYSVSISGDKTIVGARSDDDNGNGSGSAYIFTPNDIDSNNWDQQAKLLASDGAAGDKFGYSVSISGDKTIVGAIWDDDNGSNSGSAYIFKRDGESWTEQAKLLASDGAVEDEFGHSVSISGDFAIVGARYDDDNGTDSGSAYIFERACPTADLSGDCCVNFVDFAVIGNQWLQTPGVPSADLAPEGGDGVVNFLDLDILVSEWLQSN